MFSLFYFSVFQLVESSPADVINQCSSWRSLGNIVGRPEISNGVFCQVGPKAAEGNEWKECVDGSTKPEDGALTVTGLCPGSWDRSLSISKDWDALVQTINKDWDFDARSLQDSPVDQCSSWESIGHIAGRIPVVPKGVFCQVGIKAAEGNEWKQCVDGTTEPVSPGIMYTGVCPGSITDDDIAAFVAAKDRSLYGKNSGMGVMYDPRDEERQLGGETFGARSLQDTPDAAINQCSSWKSQGFVTGRPTVPKGKVWCQVGAAAAEGNDWFECADGVTKPTGGALLYTGLCPSSVGARSLQDTPDAAMKQCSSWKSLGNIVGPPGFSSQGVYCQVGPKAAEGNEWKECVDGTTKPAPPAIIYTGLCPGTMPEEVGDIHI